MPPNSGTPVGSVPSRIISPARKAVLEAEETNTRNGHEFLGAISLSHGFMPKQEPLTSFPPEYQEWDELAAKLPELHSKMGVRAHMDAMPVLDAEKLPDKYVHRAGKSGTVLEQTGVAKICGWNFSSAVRSQLAIGWISSRLVHKMEGLHGHPNLVFEEFAFAGGR
jgi:hypothetical protein